MARTYTLDIPGGLVWTPVGPIDGRISASSSCYYAKFPAATPDPTVFGYRLNSGEVIDFNVDVGEVLFVKSEQPFRITWTEGVFQQQGEWEFNDWFGLMTQGQKAVVFQNYTEANVKNGLQYFLRHLFTNVAVGATVTVKFQTGAKPVIIKSREVSFSGSSRVDYQALEGGTYTGGTAVSIRNENLVSPVPTTVSVTHSGTIGAAGTVFRDKTIFGSGSTSGGGSRIGTDVLGRETILKPNTLYYVRLTNVSGSTAEIQFELSWYEGTPDLPA